MALGKEMFQAVRKSKKVSDLEVTTPVAYPSGFMTLDYLNGQKIQVFDDDDNIISEYDSVGFVDGTMVTVIADSGLGKTTLTEQIAVNICSQFKESFIIHEDIEQASHINRLYNITHKSPRWLYKHYSIYQDTHSETVVDRFIDHAKMKLNNRKIFEYDTGLKDMFNQPIIRLIPTVVIIDSLAVMRSEDGSLSDPADLKAKNKDDIDKTSGNMSAARNAKFNSEMFKQILPFAKKANIILFVINHINKKIDIGFTKTARDIVGLGDTEAISGGRASIYLANNILRLKNKGQLKSDKDFGINGHIIEAVFYKSRTNASNVGCELIFDKSKGFSKTLTMLQFGLTNNIVKKKGNKYYIDGEEDVLFTKKTFNEIASENPRIINTLYEKCLPHLRKYLSTGSFDNIDETDDEKLDSYINVMSLFEDE